MNLPSLTERDLRQRDLVPAERLAACHALVVGVGAIGRQVALQLAAMGIAHLTIQDDDIVSVVNLAPQGYLVDDVGHLKVDATAQLCQRLHPELHLTCLRERFRRSQLGQTQVSRPEAVFVCVDSIAARTHIWQAVRSHAAFYVDGRMSAEIIRILASAAPPLDTRYALSLFDPASAYTGACTAKSTIYTASIAAGLMVSQFTRWLRRLPVDRDISLNLLASELTCSA